jgi:predicted PurR-regulated permease PerM
MSRVRGAEFSFGEPLLLCALIILTLFFAQALLIPFAFALTLSFLLTPAVSRLEKVRIPRVAAVALVVAIAFACACGVGYVVARQLMNVAQRLPGYQQNLHKRMGSLHSPSEQSLERAFDSVENIGRDLALGTSSPSGGNATSTNAQQAEAQALPVRVVDSGQNQLRTTGEFLASLLKPVGEIGVVLVFTIYMLMKREELRNRLLLLAGMGHINMMTQALGDAANRISQYLVMQAAVNACYGILFGSGLFLIGVPNATLWGAIAGILRVVPYVGTATSVVLPLVVSIAVSNTWWPPVMVIALFLLLELAAANFVEPWLFGSRTGISSLALLATAIFWALLWGWAGLVLSTPLTVCVVVLGRYVPQMAFLQTLLGAKAELSPGARFYERLLAMDQAEAHAVADRFLQGKPLVELYDSVLLPALSHAEQDRHKGVLDDVRANFLFLSIGELLAELTEYRQKIDGAPVVVATAARNPLRKEFAVVCISASDQADELTTLMLAQLMEQAGHQTLLLNAASVLPEILEGLAAEQDTVIFISALPPFAFSQARSICQRIRAQLRHNRIVIGLWNAKDDTDEMMSRFGSGRPNVIVSTLTQALQQVRQWQ